LGRIATTGGFAVNRKALASLADTKFPKDFIVGIAERFWLEEHEDSPKRIVGRDAIVQGNEVSEPLDLGFAENCYFFVRLATAEDSDDGKEQNLV
jgi:hypothetical protein